MSIIEAIILGLIQGATEFIPVSSSGHLLIGHELLGTGENGLSFDIMLHVGTLLALLLYFRRDVVNLAKNCIEKNEDGRLARLIVLATIPAGLAGLLLGDFIDEHVRSVATVATALIVVGLVMLIADRRTRNQTESVSTKQGLLVGLAQAAALIPGVSRSGATITTGIFLGLSREKAARFSFLLAIPVIAGSAVGIVLTNSDKLDFGGFALYAGMVAAFISGLAAIKFLLGVISRVGLSPFAYYRITVGVLLFIFLV